LNFCHIFSQKPKIAVFLKNALFISENSILDISHVLLLLFKLYFYDLSFYFSSLFSEEEGIMLFFFFFLPVFAGTPDRVLPGTQIPYSSGYYPSNRVNQTPSEALRRFKDDPFSHCDESCAAHRVLDQIEFHRVYNVAKVDDITKAFSDAITEDQKWQVMDTRAPNFCQEEDDQAQDCFDRFVRWSKFYMTRLRKPWIDQQNYIKDLKCSDQTKSGCVSDVVTGPFVSEKKEKPQTYYFFTSDDIDRRLKELSKQHSEENSESQIGKAVQDFIRSYDPSSNKGAFSSVHEENIGSNGKPLYISDKPSGLSKGIEKSAFQKAVDQWGQDIAFFAQSASNLSASDALTPSQKVFYDDLRKRVLEDLAKQNANKPEAEITIAPVPWELDPNNKRTLERWN
jgi:hypothetical protein